MIRNPFYGKFGRPSHLSFIIDDIGGGVDGILELEQYSTAPLVNIYSRGRGELIGRGGDDDAIERIPIKYFHSNRRWWIGTEALYTGRGQYKSRQQDTKESVFRRPVL